MRLLFLILAIMLIGFAATQQLPLPKVSIDMGSKTGSGDVSTSLQLLALLTVLSLAPAILILTTAFTRIVIIMGFLRNALGTQSIPPNQVLIGLSLFLTFFVMAPTYTQVNEQALQPYLKKQIQFDQAVERASKPMREFMLKSTYEKDLILFLDIRHEQPKSRAVWRSGTVAENNLVSE